MLAISPAAAQNAKTVTGTVTDETNNPIAGVMILQTGTNNAVITDASGSYSIGLPAGNAALDFQLIGYVSQQVAVGTRSVVNVTLAADAQQIEELVVVGYGSTKKANLTGAVASVSGERLENRAVRTITQALQGTVANLNVSTSNGAPGTAQKINIRGYTGIDIDDYGTRSNVMGSPLVVIDGVQGGDLGRLNMNDVESISVLKDAASAAIYGSSAPFGVIIVTTKKGRVGKPTITYNNNFGFSSPTNLPEYPNSVEFAEAFNAVDMDSTGSQMFDASTIQKMKDYQAGKLEFETERDPAGDAWKSWNMSWANNDWFDIYFKKASFSQQHNIGVSGASETSNYYIGLGYTTQEGLYNFANDSYSRYNVRANLSSNLTGWLTAGVRTAFSRVNIDNPAPYSSDSATGSSDYSYSMFHQLGRTWPTVPLKNPNGEYADGNNINFFTQGGRQKRDTDNAVLTGEVTIKPLEGWDIVANYTYDGSYLNNSDHTKTIYLTSPDGVITPRAGTSPNKIAREAYKNQHHTVNAFTTYEKQMGDHYLKAMLGYTQELYDDFGFTGSNDNLYSDEIPMLGATYGTNRSVGDSASQLAVQGVFGRINYNYKGKYLFELNGRYDGTSRFLKEVRYKFYPGVSAGWVVSNESFWDPIAPFVNSFKVRGSWASMGDQSFTSNRYPFYPSLGKRPPTDTNWIFDGGRQSSVSLPGIVNYDLTWVTTNTLGVGFDLGAFNNRFTFTFDWFERDARNFADYGLQLPAVLGTSAPRVNSAEILSKGFEISAAWRDKIGEVTYGVSVVLGDSKGKVVKYNNPTKLISQQWYDGAELGEIWGYETVGLFRDQAEIDGTDQSFLYARWNPGDVHYRDLDGNGKINTGDNTVNNPGDRRVIGNSTPRYNFGVNLNAEWKGFDATLFLQGTGKRDIMFSSDANYFWGLTSAWQGSYFTQHRDHWSESNPGGYLPRGYFNTDKNRQSQTRYLQNAAYLRLKNLQLGYTLPKHVTDKINFNRVRVFVTGENLLTFTKLMKIVDPEIVNSNGKVYPLQRTWAFGVNITF